MQKMFSLCEKCLLPKLNVSSFQKKRMIVLVWFALVFVFFVGGDGAFLFCFVDLVKRIQDFKEWHWVLGSRRLMTGHEQRPFP